MLVICEPKDVHYTSKLGEQSGRGGQTAVAAGPQSSGLPSFQVKQLQWWVAALALWLQEEIRSHGTVFIAVSQPFQFQPPLSDGSESQTLWV